jgi:signal transduction histidine kinase
VLSAGFGGLLAFLLAAALGTFLQLNHVRADDTRIRQDFLGRIRSLEQIRSDIYLSGSDIRDFLLSPNPGDAEYEKVRIKVIESQTQGALNQYSRELDPEERDSLQALRSEVDAWWQVLQTPFQWTPAERDRLRYTFFYEQLVPRRTTMLQIADSIATINGRGLNRAEDRLAASAESLRWSLALTFGIALLGSLVLAIATIAVTLRLEREVERRLKETTDARADLQDLSARLVRAQEEERRTLARELHDEVGQSLSAIMMEAGNLGPPGKIIAEIAEKTLTIVRDLALLLRPSMLDDFGLVPALNWHAREMSKRTGLHIGVSADEACDNLPDEHRTCVYRLVQEAVNNSARHAGARNVQVVVRNEGPRVVFSVQDDGIGFDNKTVHGLGLLGMGERVRRLGGILRIDSEPGRGTTISAELPLPDAIETESYAAHSHTAG